jgi:hypothetical protein
MSRPTWKTLIASACILSFATLALTPSSALAWGRGFGIGLGIGAIAGMAVAPPAPVYVERRPVVVAPAPVRSKTAESEKQSEKHHHKATHTADKEPVTRTMRQPSPPPQPPVATNTKPTNDADLRKCLVKEYLPDKSVVFKDTCTQEQASTAKPTTTANDTPKMTQSIQLEPAVAQEMDGP